MITIKIDKSVKCYEEKSIFVSFPYNAKIVEIIKSQKERYYNPNNKTWELPFNNLDKLRNEIKGYDIDILNSYENKNTSDLMQKEYNYIPKDYKFKITPFKHQIEGIEYGLNNDRFILADEQRIGEICTSYSYCYFKETTKEIQTLFNYMWSKWT